MKCRKSWFYNLSVILAGFFVLYALIISFTAQGKEAVSPAGFQGVLLLGLFSGFVVVRLVAWGIARFRLKRFFSDRKIWVRAAEAVVVILVIAAAVWLRIDSIQNQGHVLNEEENRYYEIATHLKEKTLLTQGASYCDFLKESPHTLGYAVCLRLAFSLWGVSVRSGLWLNVCFAAAGLTLLYLIGRKLSGRAGGLMVLAWGAFVPSEIEKVFQLTSRPVTEFFLLACSALLVHTLLDFDKEKGRAGVCFSWYILLGCLIAVGAVINPVLFLFGVVALISLLPQKMELPNKPQNDIPLLLRFMHYGWVRGILIVIPFLLLYGILFTNIKMMIDRDVSAWGTFFAALSSGLQRLQADFWGGFMRMMEQYAQIWYEDGIQGVLQVILLLSAMLGVGTLYRKEGSFHHMFVLLLLTGVASGLFLEKEAYPGELFLFCCLFLAGFGIESFFTEAEENRKRQLGEEELLTEQEAQKQRELEAYKQVEEEVTKIREEALENVFDMNYALEHGHVIMTVSEAYGKRKQDSEEEEQ